MDAPAVGNSNGGASKQVTIFTTPGTASAATRSNALTRPLATALHHLCNQAVCRSQIIRIFGPPVTFSHASRGWPCRLPFDKPPIHLIRFVCSVSHVILLNFTKYTTPALDAQSTFPKKHNTRARIYTGAGGQDQPVVINAKRSTNSRHNRKRPDFTRLAGEQLIST